MNGPKCQVKIYKQKTFKNIKNLIKQDTELQKNLRINFLNIPR